MKLRTRAAFMALLFLAGWIFAAQHRSESTATTPETPPLLQLQRSPATAGIQAHSSAAGLSVQPVRDNAPPSAPPLAESQLRRPPTDIRSPQQPGAWSPGLVPRADERPSAEFPLTGQPAAPAPARVVRPVPPAAPRPAASPPVRLLVNEIGTPTPSLHPVPPPSAVVREVMPRRAPRVTQPTSTVRLPPKERDAARANEATPTSPQKQPAAQETSIPATNDARKRETPRSPLERHRIVNGDTLENLAREYLGDPRHALLIYEANRERLTSPHILPIGFELIIPRLPNSR